MFWFFKSSAKDRARQVILPEVPISTFMPVNDDKYYPRYFRADDEDTTASTEG